MQWSDISDAVIYIDEMYPENYLYETEVTSILPKAGIMC